MRDEQEEEWNVTMRRKAVNRGEQQLTEEQTKLAAKTSTNAVSDQ